MKSIKSFTLPWYLREPESAAERLILLWKRRNFQGCHQILENHTPSPEMGKALQYILLNPFAESRLVYKRAEYHATRALAFECFWQYDASLVIPTLVPLVWYSEAAYLRLKEYGEEAVPYIDAQLLGTLEVALPCRVLWNRKGVMRCVHLLGETRSLNAVSALRRVHYTIPFLGKGVTAKYAFLVSSILSLFYLVLGIFMEATWAEIIIAGVQIWAVLFVLMYVVLSALVAFNGYVDHENTYKPAAWRAMINILDKTALSHVLDTGTKYASQLMSPDANLLAEQIKLLGVEDRGTLSTAQMRALYTFLIPEYPALCQSALAALVCVGNAESLSHIRRLQSRKIPLEIQEMAHDSYERLRVRLETDKESRELLRASHFEEDPQVLLRPSQESSEPQEQLLRPSRHED
jgi:hypothetical protein